MYKKLLLLSLVLVIKINYAQTISNVPTIDTINLKLIKNEALPITCCKQILISTLGQPDKILNTYIRMFSPDEKVDFRQFEYDLPPALYFSYKDTTFLASVLINNSVSDFIYLDDTINYNTMLTEISKSYKNSFNARYRFPAQFLSGDIGEYIEMEDAVCIPFNDGFGGIVRMFFIRDKLIQLDFNDQLKVCIDKERSENNRSIKE